MDKIEKVICLFDWLSISIFIIGVLVIVLFFATKKEGFGKYNTSTLLLLITFIFSTLLYVNGFIKENSFENIIFAILGFASGLFISNKDQDSDKEQKNRQQKGK